MGLCKQQMGILELHAQLYKDTSVRRITTAFPYDLGVYFENPEKRNFMPIVHKEQLVKWVTENVDKGNKVDPINTYPFPLVNFFTAITVQIEKSGIAAVRYQVSTPEETACTELGYTAFKVYGNPDAADHFRAYLGKVVGSKIQGRLPPSRRSGPQPIRDLVPDALEQILKIQLKIH